MVTRLMELHIVSSLMTYILMPFIFCIGRTGNNDIIDGISEKDLEKVGDTTTEL